MILPTLLGGPPSVGPTLVSIVDPQSGKSWDGRGKIVSSSVSAEAVRAARALKEEFRENEIPDWPDSVDRVLVFRVPDGGSLVGRSPAMAFNRGLLVGMGSSILGSRYRMMLARVRPTQKTLDVQIDDSTWRDTVVLAFSNRGGKMKVSKGAEWHPRLIPISPGESLKENLTVGPILGSQGVRSDSATAIVFEERAEPFDFICESKGEDFIGRYLKAFPGPSKTGRFRSEILATASGNVGNFVHKHRRVLRLKAVAMHPSPSRVRATN